MAFQYLRYAFLVAALTTITHAQKSSLIPKSLQSTFTSETEVQVSYTDNAVDGFTDSATFSKDGMQSLPNVQRYRTKYNLATSRQ